KAKKSVRLIMEKLVIKANRQRVLVRKRIERVGENKNRKRDVWNKNRQSDLVYGPRRKKNHEGYNSKLGFENVSKLSNDPLLARGNTLQSGEDSLKLKELMELCTNLQTRVLDLETTKTTQANEIAMNTLTGDEVLAEPEVVVNDVNLNVDLKFKLWLKNLLLLKSVKPSKANVVEEPSIPVSAASTKVSAATTITTATILTPRKGIIITELGTSTTTTTISSQPSQIKVQDKSKGILFRRPVKAKNKDLISLMRTFTLKLQAGVDEMRGLASEKDEAHVDLTEEWD
ncbi:hypothetical protein Tco_0120718, partial [Tanacetum coccineum]